jgi:hypothetical protein
MVVRMAVMMAVTGHAFPPFDGMAYHRFPG